MYFSNSSVVISIVLDIPWAFYEDEIPIFDVRQLGFITNSGGPCLKLDIGDRIALKNNTFYNVNCGSNVCPGGSLVSLAPSCLNDGLNLSCTTFVKQCTKTESLVTEEGIMMTTKQSVYGVYDDEHSIMLTTGGTVYIPLGNFTRIDVQEMPHKISFYPPATGCNDSVECDKVMTVNNMHYEKTANDGLINIFHFNHTLQNDIIRHTNNEIELIKRNTISKGIHMTIWGLIGLILFLMLIVVTIVSCCKRRHRKNNVIVSVV